MIFSVTERGTAKRCPRQHRLTAKGGMHLGPLISPIYLNVGTLIHNGSQAWIEAQMGEAQSNQISYEDHVTVASYNLVEKIKSRYLKQVGADIAESELNEVFDAIYFARTMARNYEIRWGSPIPEGFRILRPEQKVQVPIPGTDHFLEGRFDGLLLDQMGRVYILEHKTYAARTKSEALDHNDQFLAYMWLATKLEIGPVVGLAYDGLWRRDKVPKGRTFEDLFYRHTLTRSPRELEEFERFLPREAEMMARNLSADEDPYIDRRWQGCWDCKVEPLCTALSRGERPLFEMLVKTKFMVRDDDTQTDDDDDAIAA